jgi:hypothetical protein
MEWLNIHIPTIIRSPEFIGAEPVDRSTHIMLLAYCAQQENGGIILNCGGWKDRKWQQIAGVTLAEVRRPCDLWMWDEIGLHVHFYPVEKEREVRRKRAIAKTNGRNSGGRPRTNPDTDTETNVETDVGFQKNPTSEPTSPDSPKAEGEGKEKGKEGEGKGSGGGASEESFSLCQLHPKRDLSGPALKAAAAAIRRHGYETVRQGVIGYAEAVAAWTPAERAQFVKNAAEFFAEDLWNQPAANWPSRKTSANGHAKRRTVDIGGREPSLSLMKELYPNGTP